MGVLPNSSVIVGFTQLPVFGASLLTYTHAARYDLIQAFLVLNSRKNLASG